MTIFSTSPIFVLGLALACASCAGSPLAEKTAAAAAQQQPTVLLEGIEATMAKHRLTGLSVAVFDDYGAITTQVYGRESAGGEALTPATAFSTASISKPVTALLCLILADEGIIDLDAPIAANLKRWKVPESDQPGAAEVSWRQLLTHTAGTSQHGFADFYQGDRIPTLVDSLEGRLPRYDKPIEFLFAPGSDWKYSGGGYVIVQMALEDTLGRPLHALAQERIFVPLGMTHTTMVQPGEPGFPTDAARVHNSEGAIIRDGLPITPQVAASGMWSTPQDLAVFAIAIQRALRGEAQGPVTPAIARQMTDIISLEYVGGMGMPFFRGFGFGNTDWMRHDGSNTGVNADLLASMEGGYGFVLMGNGDDDDTGPVFAEARRRIIESRGWAGRRQVEDVPLTALQRSTLPGVYKGLLYDLGLDYRIDLRKGRLVVVSEFFSQFLGRDWSPMRHIGGNRFRIEDYPNELHFTYDARGELMHVTLSRPDSEVAPYTRDVGALR